MVRFLPEADEPWRVLVCTHKSTRQDGEYGIDQELCLLHLYSTAQVIETLIFELVEDKNG